MLHEANKDFYSTWINNKNTANKFKCCKTVTRSTSKKVYHNLNLKREHDTSTNPIESPGTPAIPSPASPSNSTRSPHPTSTPHAESTPVESSYSSILFLNSQSISPDARSSSKWKIPFISENLLNKDGSNVPILGVSETWLKSYITDAQIHIPNYIPFRGDRLSRRRGGTLLYIHEDIAVSNISPYDDTICKYVVLSCAPYQLSLQSKSMSTVHPVLLSSHLVPSSNTSSLT